jgi:hypothetical protein
MKFGIDTVRQKEAGAADTFGVMPGDVTSDYSLWHPIESTGYDFCGNGCFRKKLNPKEFILFLLLKYSGSDTTFVTNKISNWRKCFYFKIIYRYY